METIYTQNATIWVKKKQYVYLLISAQSISGMVIAAKWLPLGLVAGDWRTGVINPSRYM